MNRHWLYILSLIMLTTGCSHADDDTTSRDYDGSISFVVDNSDVTRGSVIAGRGNVFPQSEAFRVYAWKTTGSVTTAMMTSDAADPESNVVSCTSGYWAPKRRYYWPTEDDATVSFYAVYPKDYTIRRSGDDVTFDFQIPAAVSSQTDMMTAMSEGLALSATTKGAAPLGFRHITAQVAFRAQLAPAFAGWQVQVRSLRLCNVNSRGTYYYHTAGSEPTATALPLPGFNSPATTQYIVPASPAVLQSYDLVMAAPQVAVTSTSETVNLTSTTDVAMLMPQTLTAWNRQTETASSGAPSTTGCYLAIGCTITDSDGQRAFSGTTYVPLAVDWTAAKHYNYLLQFGSGYQGSGDPSVNNIGITLSIADWGYHVNLAEETVKL